MIIDVNDVFSCRKFYKEIEKPSEGVIDNSGAVVEYCKYTSDEFKNILKVGVFDYQKKLFET